MRLGVSALIHTTNAVKIKKFRDLPKQTHIRYGVVKGGRILNRFYHATEETYSQMYQKMMRNIPYSLADNKTHGIHMAKISEYAFIQESADNEFIASNDCDLTSIPDTSDYFRTEYAIALPKGSPYLSKFNFAISKMDKNGDFNRIKTKHWTGICNSAKSLLDYHNWFLLIFIILFSLMLSQTLSFNH